MITSRRGPGEGDKRGDQWRIAEGGDGARDFGRRGGRGVSELDVEWARRVAEAEERARGAGRADVADYLSLRASNDAARSLGVQWLVETFQQAAGEANRAGASLTTALEDAHRFLVGHATMVGRRLTLRAGVRSVTVEAGWPRAPRDGVVRGAGLAHARVSHFGDRGAGEELLLVRAEDGAPRWLSPDVSAYDQKERADFDEARARAHVKRLLV